MDLVTKEDLAKFKTELLEDMKLMFKGKAPITEQKEWLKSYEVRKILGISPGKLQNMRVNGTITYTQIGGLMFYKNEDIIKMMDANKHKNPFIARNK
ncbi:MAG: helix-turn-helix domain-containing protein [Bacteroidia bacterium]|nr:helix-turn-helix domain-containing protein [Bacteroidia bacterium]